jgi:hypothetical protein
VEEEDAEVLVALALVAVLVPVLLGALFSALAAQATGMAAFPAGVARGLLVGAAMLVRVIGMVVLVVLMGCSLLGALAHARNGPEGSAGWSTAAMLGVAALVTGAGLFVLW